MLRIMYLGTILFNPNFSIQILGEPLDIADHDMELVDRSTLLTNLKIFQTNERSMRCHNYASHQGRAVVQTGVCCNQPIYVCRNDADWFYACQTYTHKAALQWRRAIYLNGHA